MRPSANLRRLRGLLSLGLLAAACHAADAADGTDLSPGAAVYIKYCVLCHGVGAEGNGPAAKNLNPRPANLTRSALTNTQKEEIIRNGGASLGRSASMPPWRDELNDREIRDLINFLATVKTRKQ